MKFLKTLFYTVALIAAFTGLQLDAQISSGAKPKLVLIDSFNQIASVQPAQNKNSVLVIRYGDTLGDQKGGAFMYDGTSTATVDGLNVFVPASGVGRWLRYEAGAYLNITGNTADRVIVTDSSGNVTTSANLTFDDTTLALTGNETVSGALSVSGIHKTEDEIQFLDSVLFGSVTSYDRSLAFVKDVSSSVNNAYTAIDGDIDLTDSVAGNGGAIFGRAILSYDDLDTQGTGSSLTGWSAIGNIGAASTTVDSFNGFQSSVSYFGAGSQFENLNHYTASLAGAYANTGEYGFKVGGTPAANSFAFHNSTTAPSYFEGDVGIGDSTPSTELDVAGQVTVQTLNASTQDTVVTHNSGVLEQRTINPDVWNTSASLASNGVTLVSPTLHFDGSNDYFEVADSDKLSFTDGTDDLPLAISAWVKPEDLTVTSPILTKYGTSNGVREWSSYLDSTGRPAFLITDTSGNICTIVAANPVTQGKLFHYAVTYEGAGPNSSNAFTSAGLGFSLFVDGEDVTSTATVTSSASYAGMSNTTQPAWIGRTSSTYVEGSIKEVKLYNRELSASEVATIKDSDLGFADAYGGAESTSGTLTIGKRYRLLNFIAGDDFTNVGASSNADFVEFIATGTTPTTWTNSSVVEDIGTLLDMRAVNYDADTGKLYDLTTNDFVGVNNGASVVGRTYPIYETGTWTPAVTFGGGSTGVTYSEQEGYYTRVGNICNFSGSLRLTAKGSDTGAVKILGLPFTCLNSPTTVYHVEIASIANFTGLTSALSLRTDRNATTITLLEWTSTGTTGITDAEVTNTSVIGFSGTYQIQ